MAPPSPRPWIPLVAAFGLLAVLIVGVLVIDSGRRSSTLSGAVGWVAADPVGGSPGDADISVNLLVPGTTTAGTTLRYQVVLVNNSSSPQGFDPCPDYTQTLGSQSTSYALNCTSAKPIPAKGREVFDMQLAVPAGTTGTQSLRWELTSVARDAGVTASVTVKS